MGLFLYILCIILCLVYPSDKRVFFSSILVSFLVFGFNTWTVDRTIYKDRFQLWNADFFFENTEPIYSSYIKFLNQLGVSYQGFIVINALFFVSVLSFYLLKTTKQHNYALGLYLIAAFMFEVSMLRNTFAFCFMIPAFYFLIYKKNYYIYIILTCIACLCHISSIIFFIFLLCYVDTKTLLKFVIIACLILFPLTYVIKQYMLDIFPLIGLEQKAEMVFEQQEEDGNIMIAFILASFRLLSIAFLCFGTLFILERFNLATKFPRQILNINIISLLILPILMVSNDSYRPMFVICLVNLCSMTIYNNSKVYTLLFFASINVAYWIYGRSFFLNIFLKPLLNNELW